MEERQVDKEERTLLQLLVSIFVAGLAVVAVVKSFTLPKCG